ncbi:ATP-binding domain-containing protein [Metabacillus litoralis]|uniref:ATP-binding domain-containing protein n=1 Tax=Metabacillus litoralis TaxID=152268 RepID=UPI00203CE0FC|nr:ATP-binding domain-containing protein [Metabacillus litoralis]MCM3162700.1 AAA family ATPase [Metabacillus litoralis]
MSLLSFLKTNKDKKFQERQAHHSEEVTGNSRISQLEKQLEQLKQDSLIKEKVYNQVNSALANFERLGEGLKLVELEKLKVSYHELEQKNNELSKRPSLEEYNFKNNQVMQLSERLEQLTVSQEAHTKIELHMTQLKQELQKKVNRVEELERLVSKFEKDHHNLQLKIEDSKVIYKELDDKYTKLRTEHDSLQSEYNQQIQLNNQLQLQIQEMNTQMEQVQQLLLAETASTNETLYREEEKLSEDELLISKENARLDEVIENIEAVEGKSITTFVLEEEDTEKIVFDELIEEEKIDESELFVERDVDDTQVTQTMSEVLLKTVPVKDESEPPSIPAYDASSFLSRKEEAEHSYLKQVIKEINSFMQEITKINFNDTYEVDYSTAYVEGILRKRRHENNQRLHYMKEKPYIGRVDYVSADGAETMYIGEQGIDGYVTSWKAEAASLYFLRTVGVPIAHKTLGETIVDYIRQIDIQAGKIKTLHPPITATSQYIKDEGLVSALKGKRGLDMQSIVATLQREQYEIIRLPMTQPIIIQGSAGSGKSAIALHRLSYLLYKYKNLKPESVAIVGPNEAFLKHIKNVLPKLGDFGIIQTTLLDLASNILMLSPSKIKCHKAADLETIKIKGSLEFRDIVERTTINMFNDLRIWANAYTFKSISIPIVPILREMEKYPHLTLKERENLYFNFYLKSLQQELKNENDLKQQFEQWVKDKAKEIEKQSGLNLPLNQNEFISAEIAELGNQWLNYDTIHKAKRSEKTKKQMELSRQAFITEIQNTIQVKMEEHHSVLQKLIPGWIDEAVITKEWHYYIQCELRKAKEVIILDHIKKQSVEVTKVDTEKPSIQNQLQEAHERVLQQLSMKQETFYKDRKDMIQQALLEETLMRIERGYNRQITKALKSSYQLEYGFTNNYLGFKFEEKRSLSSDEMDMLKVYVKKHLELDYLDCFDESIRVAISEGLLPDNHSRDIYYEDLPALLHIMRLLNGVANENKLSYLIVDEAQDYMPYEIVELNALTRKNGLMLIGDLGQNLNRASSLQDWHALDPLIGEPAYYELQATYRSTAQIVQVGNEIIQPFATGKYQLSTETFRDGEDVEWVEVSVDTEEKKLVSILEEAIYTHKYESVAVVVKDESLLKHYHYMIDPYFSVAIQTAEALPTNVKVVITTPTAVKGLEFEVVVIARFNDYQPTDFDRKLAYVATSRALHQLYITYEKGKECLIK